MNILKIIIHIAIFLLLVLGWGLYFERNRPKLKNVMRNIGHWFKKNWRGVTWFVIYVTLTSLSSIFVFRNWEECLNIVFFSHFNGYNIIWVLWVFLLFVPLITVDNQWFKIDNPLTRKEKQIQEAKQRVEIQQVADNLKSLNVPDSLNKDAKGKAGDDCES